jgi:hypothetical protein
MKLVWTKTDKPVLSHNLFKELVYWTELRKKESNLFVVIDNLRYDQWKVLRAW